MAFYVKRSVHMKNSDQHFQRKLKNLTFIIKKKKFRKEKNVCAANEEGPESSSRRRWGVFGISSC
jgi:hypothetical protein